MTCSGLHGCGGHGTTVAVITDRHGAAHHVCAACISDLGWLVHQAGQGWRAKVERVAEIRIVAEATP